MATLYYNGAVDSDWNTLGNWWTSSAFATQASALPTSSDSVVLSATCDTNGGSEPTVVNFTLNDPSSGAYYIAIAFTVTGNATFNGSSYNDSTVTGNATFNDNSYNSGTGTVTGNATFTESSYTSTPAGGTITGIVTFSSATPVTFNLSGVTYMQDSTNWVFSGGTPTWNFTDDSTVGSDQGGSVVQGNCNTTGGNMHADVTGNLTMTSGVQWRGFVSGNATYTNAVAWGQGSVVIAIVGDATFLGGSHGYNVLAAGTATFDISSAMAQIEDSNYASFEATSVVILFDKGVNGSSILGIV